MEDQFANKIGNFIVPTIKQRREAIKKEFKEKIEWALIEDEFTLVKRKGNKVISNFEQKRVEDITSIECMHINLLCWRLSPCRQLMTILKIWQIQKRMKQ